jgi:predicted ATP-binding protein involved in virulence
MYLKHLTLRNIRCFEQAEISFDQGSRGNRKWTVLLGENGTGKSTVLKAVAALMAGSDAVGELLREPHEWLRGGTDEGEITAILSTKKNETRDISLTIHDGDSYSRFLRRNGETLALLDDALSHSIRNYPIFGYGAARRLSGGRAFESSTGYSHPRARSLASLFDRNAQLNPLEQWAMRLDYASDGAQLDVVSQVLNEFLPELTFAEIDKKNETLLFDTPDGLVPLAQLSDGYQTVAAWVGDLLYQITDIFDDYTNPLQARGVLVIDEVDLHLHPKWQRRLIDFLDQQLPNMQIIATTHSVVTAQQAPENALFYCIRRDDGPPVVQAFEGDPGNLLLNQLILTEAFGHIPDESVDLVETKKRYRELHDKTQKSAADKREMKAISKRVRAVPEDPSEAIVLNPRQRELMESMLSKSRGEPE